MLFLERPITVEHVRAFCTKFHEGYRVEYKSAFDSSVREKVPKIVSSFANSHGGVLVVGVKTNKGVPQPPFEGFQAAPREEFTLTVENICLQNIYPPILPRTTVVESDLAGHVFLVVEVDESAQAPHAIENSRMVYVRTGNASNPYDLADVDLILELVKRRKEPFELRSRLLERAKKRFNTHLDIKHSDRGGARTVLGPLLQLSIGPRFPTRQLCSQVDLKAFVQSSSTPWRGTIFPTPQNRILFQHESAVVLDAAGKTSIFEVNIWGMVFYATTLRSELQSTSGIHMGSFLGDVLLFVRHAGKLFQSLGYSGVATIEITLSPILKVMWQHGWGGYSLAEEGSQLDDEIVLQVPTTSEALQETPDQVAVDIFRHVLLSVNLPNLVNSGNKLESLVRNGYDYNSWRPPPGLIP